MTKRLLIKLEKSSYISIRVNVRLINPLRLMKAWGYTYSLKEIETAEFMSAERPQYSILKIANWARAEGITCAFTLFSATEHIRPYVSPSNTHVYVLKEDLPKWQEFFRKENILPAEKEGNIVCLLVDKDYFYGVEDVRGISIISIPQLYADLIAYGGRGEDAAQELLKAVGEKINV
ncbi:MAG: type IV toxin-antitoxin system AbiEi family antitoxin [Nanoarchaeota archaeon]|nr:type IV toxin-antitoxin system AbiEi family antitoxin [Nanoarchaeota archaeon]